MKYSAIKRRIAFYKSLSIIISYLLHPLVMPTLIFAIVFYFCPMAFNISPQIIGKLLSMILITTFVFPVLSTFVLFYVVKRNFSMSDLHMNNRGERFYPFLFTGFFYAAITYMFIRSGNYDANIIAIMGGISLSAILVAFITYFWMISAHAVGICGTLGYTLVVSYYYPYELMLYPIVVITMLAGLLMSARLYLNVHNSAQVFSGAFLGLVVSILSFVLFQTFGYIFF